MTASSCSSEEMPPHFFIKKKKSETKQMFSNVLTHIGTTDYNTSDGKSSPLLYWRSFRTGLAPGCTICASSVFSEGTRRERRLTNGCSSTSSVSSWKPSSSIGCLDVPAFPEAGPCLQKEIACIRNQLVLVAWVKRWVVKVNIHLSTIPSVVPMPALSEECSSKFTPS